MVSCCAQGRQARVRVHVLLTSYESVLLELTDLKRLDWEIMIVDEGHRLKNRESRLFQVCGSSMHGASSFPCHALWTAQSSQGTGAVCGSLLSGPGQPCHQGIHQIMRLGTPKIKLFSLWDICAGVD